MDIELIKEVLTDYQNKIVNSADDGYQTLSDIEDVITYMLDEEEVKIIPLYKFGYSCTVDATYGEEHSETELVKYIYNEVLSGSKVFLREDITNTLIPINSVEKRDDEYIVNTLFLRTTKYENFHIQILHLFSLVYNPEKKRTYCYSYVLNLPMMSQQVKKVLEQNKRETD